MKNIILLGFCLSFLCGCSYVSLQGEMFEEVVIRNASGDTLTDVQLYFQKGTKNKAIQTNAIYPFSQVSMGFPPRKSQGARAFLSWQQGGKPYAKDLAPSLLSVEDKREIHVFTVIVGSHGDVQTTVEPVR